MTVMAMPMAWTWAPWVGAMPSLGGRKGLDLSEDDASCNRSTSF
jgi:hypothetical protein